MPKRNCSHDFSQFVLRRFSYRPKIMCYLLKLSVIIFVLQVAYIYPDYFSAFVYMILWRIHKSTTLAEQSKSENPQKLVTDKDEIWGINRHLPMIKSKALNEFKINSLRKGLWQYQILNSLKDSSISWNNQVI